MNDNTDTFSKKGKNKTKNAKDIFNIKQVIGNRYKILEKIGEGGMGIVYKALDMELGIEIAIKTLKYSSSLTSSNIENLKHELLIARQITHENICRIHQLEKFKDIYFITMEYIKGKNLNNIIDESEKIDIKTNFKILNQILKGINKAHSKGIIHLDLKPGNILIDKNDNVKITDFGISRTIKEKNDEQVLLGTPYYIAPEQFSSEDMDQRADIYSFGIIAYKLLTGINPYKNYTFTQLLNKDKLKPPPSTKTINKKIPQKINKLILKCIKSNKNERPSNVKYIQKILEFELKKLEHSTIQRIFKKAGVLFLSLSLFFVFYFMFFNQKNSFDLENYKLYPIEITEKNNEHPAISKNGNSISFTEKINNKNNIIIKNNSKTKNITKEFKTNSYHPVWSPDEKKLLFSSEEKGGGIFIYYIRTGKIEKIVNLKSSYLIMFQKPSWFPDSDRFVYSDEKFSYIYNLKNNSRKKLFFYGTFLDISPDSKKVLYCNQTASNTIFIANLKEKTKEILIKSEQYISNPKWLNNKSLAFIYKEQGFYDIWATNFIDEYKINNDYKRITSGIWVHEFDVALEKRNILFSKGIKWMELRLYTESKKLFLRDDGYAITNERTSFYYPDISPDEKKIVFNSPRKGNMDIWLYDLNNKSFKKFFLSKKNNVYPVWSSDGGKIVYFCIKEGNSDIHLYNIHNNKDYKLTTHPAEDYDPCWASAVNKVTFASARSGKSDIYNIKINPITGEPLEKPKKIIASPEFDYAPTYSPDGKFLAFISTRDGSDKIFLKNLLSKKTIKLTGGKGFDSYPHFSDNGKFIYFISNRNGCFEIWKINILTLKYQQISNLKLNKWPYGFSIRKNKIIIPINRSKSDIWMIKFYENQ